MKIAKIEFEYKEPGISGVPTVVMSVSDADGNVFHRHAAEYKGDKKNGVIRLLAYVEGVLSERWKDADGSPSFTWHK